MNPERFRLHYILGLTPADDGEATRWNLGRRRGKCFHALLEGVKRSELVAEFGEELVARCEVLFTVFPDLEAMDWVERSFEIPIGDGKHSINGRIDHRFLEGVDRIVGDCKTTKGTRTKKEVQDYLGELTTSPQSHFYLHAARHWGEPTDRFRYHVLFDHKDAKSKPTYWPIDLYIGETEVARTMASVYAACEAIEGLLERVGESKPWPHSNHWPCCGDRFFCGYQELCGRELLKGCIPPGFTNRYASEDE